MSNDNAVANVLIRHGVGGAADRAKEIYIPPSLSVSVSTFQLVLMQPKSSRLLEPFTEAELTNFVSTIRYVVRGVTFWSSDETETQLMRELIDFTRLLRTHWQRSFESSLRQNLQQHTVSFSKKDVRVRLTNNDDLKRKFDSLTSGIFRRVDDLRNAIGRSNLIVPANPTTVKSFINHPEAKEYSFISGLAARTGGLIKRGVELSHIEASSREILETDGDYVIVAPAGFGKSSFCNRNALYDLQELRDQKSDVVPILVRLHGLARKTPASFEAAFLASADTRELWDTRAQSKRRLRFYLDGLDEVPDELEQAKLMKFANELKAADPTTQLIVTCREHVAGEHLRSFLRLNLAEMDDDRCAQFICRWLADDNEKITRFRAQIAGVPALKQLMRTPLLATLIMSVFSTTGTIPESRIRIYDMFVSLMAGGWDIAKNIQRGSEYGSQPKLTVLQALAWKLQIGGRRDASQFEFAEAVKDQLPSMAEQSSHLLREILQDGLLVQSGPSFVFAHLSFQEYLAAKDLLEPTGRKISTAISDFLRGQTWWKDVLSFYVSLSSQPKTIEDFIRINVRKIAGKTFDPQIIVRARFLLAEIATAFPGSSPSFDFPELAGKQLTFESVLAKSSSQ